MDTKKIEENLIKVFEKIKIKGNENGEINDSFQKIYKELETNPKNYSNPVRIYCDIDGVLSPFPEFDKEALLNYYNNNIELTEENIVNKDKLVEKEIELPQKWTYTLNAPLFEKSMISYSPESVEVVKKLSEISDFIWLTTWREFAPLIWDKYFGVNSIGYLPWERKLSDHNHYFKGVAFNRDQHKYPSEKFIWIDDHANKDHEIKGYLNNYKDGLLITTNGDKGLTNEHYEQIINFINS